MSGIGAVGAELGLEPGCRLSPRQLPGLCLPETSQKLKVARPNVDVHFAECVVCLNCNGQSKSQDGVKGNCHKSTKAVKSFRVGLCFGGLLIFSEVRCFIVRVILFSHSE